MLVAIIIVFILGYLCIALENFLRINKAAIALVTGVLCWTLYIISSNEKDMVSSELIEHLGNLSQILFFLLGASSSKEFLQSCFLSCCAIFESLSSLVKEERELKDSNSSRAL